MNKVQVEKAYNYAKDRSIAPLVTILREGAKIKLDKAKSDALGSREDVSFDDFWKKLTAAQKKSIGRYKGTELP